MITDIKQAQIKRPTTWGSSALEVLRQHPLAAYFILAFAITWVWEIPLFGLTGQNVLGPWVILCPTTAGIIMAGIMGGGAGIVRLLRRFLIWRVNPIWYLVALLLYPAIWLVSMALEPGAIAAFRVPDPSFLITYLVTFVMVSAIALAVEEFGWRGFALPLLQARFQPLAAGLILGVLWGLWHLPLQVFLPNLEGETNGFIPFVFAFTLYVGQTVAGAVIYTWLFNHTRGSILLVTLIHGSTNAAGGTFGQAFFPSLFPVPVVPTICELAIIGVALLVIVGTRARLGYDQYQREFRTIQ